MYSKKLEIIYAISLLYSFSKKWIYILEISSMSSSNIWKKIGTGAAIIGGVIASVALIPIGIGFGTAGVVGGSIAAGIKAAIGNVVEGSIFAGAPL